MRLPALLLTLPLCMTLQDDKPKDKGPEVGAAAPAFALNDHTGNKVSLGGESSAWHVIACYPKAMTPG